MRWVDLSISIKRSALAAWPHINTATVAAASGEIGTRMRIAEPALAPGAYPLGPEPEGENGASALAEQWARRRQTSGPRPYELSLWLSGGRIGARALAPFSREDFISRAVENAQRDRPRRPGKIRGGDDGGRHVGSLDFDILQDRCSATRRRADQLNPELLQRRGKFVCWRGFGGRWTLARRGLIAFRRQNRVHRHPDRGVGADAPPSLLRHCGGNESPIPCDWLRTGLFLPPARFGIGGDAEIADQRLGLGINPFGPCASPRQPGKHRQPLPSARSIPA